MSHNLDEMTPGTYAFVDTRDDAWHRLGTVIPQGTDVMSALDLAHLTGWNVRKLPITATEITENGVSVVEIPERFATVRTNPLTGSIEPLGVVGNRYTVFQNEQTAEFLETLIDVSGHEIETAGSLDGGRSVFASVRMPEAIQVAKADVADIYLIVRTSHDGSSPLTVFLSSIRPVCQNTLSLALASAKSEFSIRHTQSLRGRVQEAREALEMSFKYADAFETEAEALLAQPMSGKEFDQFLNGWFGIEGDPEDVSTRRQGQMDSVRSLWNGSPTLVEAKGTRYGAFQAVTEYLSHFSEARGTGAEQKYNRAQRDVLDSKPRNRAWALLSA